MSTTKTVTQTQQDSDSIEVSQNAKGDYSFTVKVYGDDADMMLTRVANIYDNLHEQFKTETK